ncbi:Diadenosine tetraphosphate (Ap4A) hydrolase [Halopseudomonas xinjiangensis]|uniref:Diadenosine tetraphosphate (Ap4A) hydrolase n=1 Tax=Halopseudomonas xinjiangensis TaxID=487184 RepID=A0A1H1UJ46_9GAMM|nr:HIT family protein [Halopseudomonas xinjiangensis]SDS72483.1 Diadenosine tetraphosphate (Ap4A) hydrolase [Halopseudomonas xinjiangensis]
MFELHPQLAQDCITVGDLPLSRVLLTNDAQYPWLILVPRREDVTEIFELSEGDQRQLHTETTAVAHALKDAFGADKMNIAALGNMVSQLHVHVIVRYRGDISWPAPVWGKFPAVHYTDEARQQRLDTLRAVFDKDFNFTEVEL